MSTTTRLRVGGRYALTTDLGVTRPAGTHVVVLAVYDYTADGEGIYAAIAAATTYDYCGAPNPAYAPVACIDELAPLTGCDNCDAWFDPETDPDAHEGGDRQTEGGLVAYPDLCGDCVRAQTPRALWNKAVPS